MSAARNPLAPAELGAWRGFLRVHSALFHDLNADLETRFGLPLSSYEVLISLADAPDERLRMAELANQVLLSRSGMTRLVDRLQKQGLISREPCDCDARGFYAVLTAKGRELLRQARPAHLEGVRELFLRELSEEELASLSAIWDKLLPGAAKT